MANNEIKVKGARLTNSGAYQITASCGYDVNGKQMRKYRTWRPEKGWSPARVKKELEKAVFQFSEECKQGLVLDGSIRLCDFIEQWFDKHAAIQLEVRTLDSYRLMVPRINASLGHLKLKEIQPYHIESFYKSLSEEGARADSKYHAVEGFKEAMKERGYSAVKIAENAGIGERTARIALNGGNVNRSTAEAICEAVGVSFREWFVLSEGSKKLSGSTVKKYHAFLSSVLTKAVRWQIIDSNPCSRAEPPKTRKKEIQCLDEIESVELLRLVDRMYHSAEDKHKYKSSTYRTAVYVTLFTGLRRGEVCGLKWSDIDFKAGTINVARAVKYTPEKGLFVGSLKTESSRRVLSVPNIVLDVLKNHRKLQRKEKLLLGADWDNSEWVFTKWNGELINIDTLGAWFKRFVEKSDLPNVTFHALRHSSASLLIVGGADVKTVSRRLGHAQTSTTLNIYSHATKSADERASETLETMLTERKAVL